MKTPSNLVASAEFGEARMQLRQQLKDNPRDGNYLLHRIRVGVLTLADGYPHGAQQIFEEVYEVLRQQGVNRDRVLQSVVLNEDLKIWKGEPFEQALAMAYYAMTMAELESWDNARAALENANLFLRDVGRGAGKTDENTAGIDTADVARRSQVYEDLVAQGVDPEEAYSRAQSEEAVSDGPNHGYVVDKHDFTLGFLLAGVANQQLDREEEASDNYAAALRIRPELKPLVEVLRQGRYNTLLVVSWGLGPRRQGVGEDYSQIAYLGRSPDDDRPLRVRVGDSGGGDARAYPLALNVNDFATRYTWGGLARTRAVKSTLGTGLVYGGLATTAIGANHNSDAAVIAGLAAVAAGAFLKAGSHIDPRYVDVYPQRYYVIPLTLPEEPTRIEMSVDGYPSSRLVLVGLGAPRTPEAQLRYVRLVSDAPYAPVATPSWATSGAIVYGNAHTGPTGDVPLPYILGGSDVRFPTERVLDEYWDAGLLEDMTLNELRNLYRDEGIELVREDSGRYPGLHVLEGGKSIASPLPGTTGFMRLFGQRHEPYVPETPRVAELQQEIAQRAAPTVAAGRKD